MVTACVFRSAYKSFVQRRTWHFDLDPAEKYRGKKGQPESLSEIEVSAQYVDTEERESSTDCGR
jgi:hypothetical protein